MQTTTMDLCHMWRFVVSGMDRGYTLLREFVEKIVVHEATAADGRMHGNLRRQEIEIYYSFVGKVDLPE